MSICKYVNLNESWLEVKFFKNISLQMVSPRTFQHHYLRLQMYLDYTFSAYRSTSMLFSFDIREQYQCPNAPFLNHSLSCPLAISPSPTSVYLLRDNLDLFFDGKSQVVKKFEVGFGFCGPFDGASQIDGSGAALCVVGTNDGVKCPVFPTQA